MSVVLDSDRFEEFLRCLSLLKDICNDVNIQNGIIRQRTTDRSSVFEIDLRPIVEEMSIPLPSIKPKLDLLKTFSGQDVTISSGGGSCEFSDQYSKLKFDSPDPDYMDNKFITPEEMATIISYNEEDMMLFTKISKTISKRIQVVTDVFNVSIVTVVFDGEHANISTRTQGRDQFAQFMQEITSETETKCSTDLVITPFIADHDGDIDFRMFQLTRDGDPVAICINKFNFSISDIDIKVFTRAPLMYPEPEEEDSDE